MPLSGMGGVPLEPLVDDEPVKLLLVDDREEDLAVLQLILADPAYTLVPVKSGQEALKQVLTGDFAVILLDVMLPGLDGFEVARRIRTFSDAYIIMLTARVDEIDALMGLESGADDYITKPFRPRELRARIETMLRRPRDRAGVGSTGQFSPPAPAAPTSAPAAAPTVEPAVEQQAPQPFAAPAPQPQAPPTVPQPVVEHPPLGAVITAARQGNPPVLRCHRRSDGGVDGTGRVREPCLQRLAHCGLGVVERLGRAFGDQAVVGAASGGLEAPHRS